jgi:DNA-binding transcriptional ArsR family regulator
MNLIVKFSEIYECYVSLLAYWQKQHHSTLDMGSTWVKQVRAQTSQSTEQMLADKGFRPSDIQALLLSMLWHSPYPDAESFVDWVANMDTGNLYEMLESRLEWQRIRENGGLQAHRDRAVQLFSQWNREYFSHVQRSLLDALAEEAAERQGHADGETPRDVVAKLTKGVQLETNHGLREIILIPQFHFSPWNIHEEFADTRIYLYPVDVWPDEPEAVPRSLLRLMRAVADESRLRILRFVAVHPRTFTEIVEHTGLSKGTVHHHLVALRAAGLLWLETSGDSFLFAKYTVNDTALSRLTDEVQSFVFQFGDSR